tara:strand:+ start:169 stop:588 length:420 start_codon:yes stop_codon:yes gene_type:complete
MSQQKTKLKKKQNFRHFTKNGKSKQDIISEDIDKMYEQVKDCIPIPKSNYKDVPLQSWIKYISYEGKFRFGGTLIINEAPEYFVLKSDNITWSVNLKKNKIFMVKPKETPSKEKTETDIIKDKLYELFQQNLIDFKKPN